MGGESWHAIRLTIPDSQGWCVWCVLVYMWFRDAVASFPGPTHLRRVGPGNEARDVVSNSNAALTNRG